MRNGRRVVIKLHAPERQAEDWICRFEIGWPGQPAARWGSGVDALQALVQALQMIGAEVYTSADFEAGDLTWLPGYSGCGLPVPTNVRHLLQGDDARQL
jgi:hypothetical protein